MELLDNMCHMESHFGPFRDSICFSARLVTGLHLMHHMISNHFGHLMVLLVQGAQVNARFGLFGDSANLDAR